MLNTSSGIGYILKIVSQILNFLIPILITVAVVWFILGIIKYVTANNEDAQKEGRTMIISGVIGLFVITAIWGLVKIIGDTFGIGSGNTNFDLPCVPNPSAGIYC